jgi:hypothetical protein
MYIFTDASEKHAFPIFANPEIQEDLLVFMKPEDWNSNLQRNIAKPVPVEVVSFPRRNNPSETPKWEP